MYDLLLSPETGSRTLLLRSLLDQQPHPFLFWLICVFVIGCCIGSFLNVCIWRLPRGESLLYPASHCPNCGHMIRPWENIPLISYLALRGKCSSCAKQISPRYFLVELLTGVLFSVVFLRIYAINAPAHLLPLFLFLTAILVAVAFTDCDTHLIPDQLTYTLIGIGLLNAFLVPSDWFCTSRWFGLLAAGIASGSVAAIFYGLTKFGHLVFGRNAFGWGDVKYLIGITACLGLSALLYTILTGCILAIGSRLLLSAFRKRKRRGFAFGPFLSAALYLWLLTGSETVGAYLSLIQQHNSSAQTQTQLPNYLLRGEQTERPDISLKR